MARPKKAQRSGAESMMSFRIPTELKEALQVAAVEDSRSLTGQLLHAVKEHLKERGVASAKPADKPKTKKA